ncbi:MULTISPECIES: 3-phosphoserine/phosphohydroxythreonine transaminase [Deefgea]|uniref:Phosphoserine aminotransferase n=1 Tax=Deefgea chitinilytica TaxID=570276 RepID=A0ABS2C7W6_9NEIS|nr:MULTISPECIES: 3-phosphoserine/phosphohydroxythreonine transaminase [Deefgea]MBM5570243.1 3-phosphoserine/phosphohydroxythreonine transaminase [Deefgea chitinilytica]MBM9887472.1 3-phosphoserine/phosphohydroxythreonine transaminase [Deefgea sp. CFH1-16]
MTQVFNFSAGPAVLPSEVLRQVQAELLDWHGSGMSVMEMSHRGIEFGQILSEAEADLRALMAIPDNYKVLFLQGGAMLQFSMLPLNFAQTDSTIDFVHTGHWSKGAIAEAKRYAKVNIVASSEDKNFSYVPEESTWQRTPDAAYLHYCSNETIGGVEFNHIPQSDGVPLICDMSSNILSRPIDVSQFAVIYAGAQKNIGPSGVALSIVREDMLGKARSDIPTLMNYKTFADNGSMYNTPPTFGIYVAGLVFKWLLKNGGLAVMEQKNIAKANVLYSAIDASNGFYHCPVALANRSRMNIPFTLADSNLDKEFLAGAEARHLLQLKGHRSVGGMRASIYNAMPLEGCQALAAYMNEFAKTKG